MKTKFSLQKFRKQNLTERTICTLWYNTTEDHMQLIIHSKSLTGNTHEKVTDKTHTRTKPHFVELIEKAGPFLSRPASL